MDKDFVLLKFQTEYLNLWRNSRAVRNREEEKERALQGGDMHKVITMHFEQAEAKYRIQELKTLSKLLELDWKEVRKLVEKELDLLGIEY